MRRCVLVVLLVSDALQFLEGVQGGLDVVDDHQALAVDFFERAPSDVLGCVLDDLAEGFALIVGAVDVADEL